MKAILRIPATPERRRCKVANVFRLTWTTDHAASRYGLGVMLCLGGEILDGSHFRALRRLFGADIETDEPAKVCRALGVPQGEPGIVRSVGN